jgi:hypothetical protein
LEKILEEILAVLGEYRARGIEPSAIVINPEFLGALNPHVYDNRWLGFYVVADANKEKFEFLFNDKPINHYMKTSGVLMELIKELAII